MHQQSHFPRPGAATARLGWDQQDTSRAPHLWELGGINHSTESVQQELLRLRMAGQPRERFLCSPGLSLRNQDLLLKLCAPRGMCGHSSHTELLAWGPWRQKGWWALFHSLLNVSNAFSSLQELMTFSSLQDLLCPWCTEGKWQCRASKLCPGTSQQRTTDLNFISWHPPKWEHPLSSVPGLFLEVQGDSFYTVMTEDVQAALEQVWGTKQHNSFPSTTPQPQNQQNLQRAMALMPEKGLLEKAIRQWGKHNPLHPQVRVSELIYCIMIKGISHSDTAAWKTGHCTHHSSFDAASEGRDSFLPAAQSNVGSTGRFSRGGLVPQGCWIQQFKADNKKWLVILNWLQPVLKQGKPLMKELPPATLWCCWALIFATETEPAIPCGWRDSNT